jgi:hypothetical protein
MWDAVLDLGFDGNARVLEPGCGSGNFLGFAPAGAWLTGVELDPTTAEITRHLYGQRAMIPVRVLATLPRPGSRPGRFRHLHG